MTALPPAEEMECCALILPAAGGMAATAIKGHRVTGPWPVRWTDLRNGIRNKGACIEVVECVHPPNATILRDPDSLLRSKLIRSGLWPDDVPSDPSELGNTFLWIAQLSEFAVCQPAA